MSRDTQLAELEARLHRDHLVDGVVYVRWQRGDTYAYDTGADNALFTGFALAQASFAYSVDPTLERLQRVRDLLAGIELLTTVTGTPGVLTRLAFPVAGAWERIGYDPSNMDPSNTWTRRRLDGYLFESTSHMYVTRTTRDQLVGVVAGLAAAHVVLSETRSIDPFLEGQCLRCVEWATGDLHRRLERTRFSLRDHTGSTHGTSAHRVLGPLRHALRLLDHRVNGTPLRGSLRLMYRWMWLHTFYYRWTRSTFAWNLRMTTGLTLWLLGERDARRWVKRCWGFVEHHNPWFQAIAQKIGLPVTNREAVDAARAIEALIATPYGGFASFQKPSTDWRGAPDRVGPGLDVLLPAWLQRWIEKERGA